MVCKVNTHAISAHLLRLVKKARFQSVATPFMKSAALGETSSVRSEYLHTLSARDCSKALQGCSRKWVRGCHQGTTTGASHPSLQMLQKGIDHLFQYHQKDGTKTLLGYMMMMVKWRSRRSRVMVMRMVVGLGWVGVGVVVGVNFTKEEVASEFLDREKTRQISRLAGKKKNWKMNFWM